MQLPVYLDYNATTPCDPQVLEAMLPWFTQNFGNAASKTHAYGWVAEEAVTIGREQVAHLLKADASEIIFTSGATEAVNLAIQGVFHTYHTKGRHIITWQTEHKAVLDTCAALEKQGAELSYLPVNSEGLPNLDLLAQSIRPDTVLIAAMYANNETGVVFPIQQIGALAKEKQVLFFTDATQAAGKLPMDVQADGIDLLALSAHKLYGPKGVGALYVRRKNPRVKLKPLLYGGGQEKGLRSGTLNVPGIVGLGKACALAGQLLHSETERLKALRNQLLDGLLETGCCTLNGNRSALLPHVANLSFSIPAANQLITRLQPQLALSSGSACSSALAEPSHVLKAMGCSDAAAAGSIRFSLGRFTTEEDIRFAVEAVREKTVDRS